MDQKDREVLKLVRRGDFRSARQAGKLLGVSRQTVVERLHMLEEKGFVERRSSALASAYLTQSGLEELGYYLPKIQVSFYDNGTCDIEENGKVVASIDAIVPDVDRIIGVIAGL